MPRKSKKPVRKQTHSPTGKVVGQGRSDTATDDSWDRGHEGGSDGMGVRARTDSSAPTAQRGRRGDRGAQGQAREGANS